jgi:hypothetical protein
MAIAVLAAGCSLAAACSAGSPPDQHASPTSGAAPSFVNKVWTVAESQQVAPGELRVFLSNGTLVMASSTGTPAFGTWKYKDGRLTITEEGIPYSVDIMELTSETFQIRIHNPGEPVVIRFALADSPPLTGTAPDGRR